MYEKCYINKVALPKPHLPSGAALHATNELLCLCPTLGFFCAYLGSAIANIMSVVSTESDPRHVQINIYVQGI